MLRFLSAVTLSLLIFGSPAFAAGSGNRASNVFGVFLAFDTPYPSVGAANIGVNLSNWGRISAGYGQISASTVNTSTLTTTSLTATTIGGQLNFFVPSWNFSPTIGVGYANVDVQVTGTASATDKVGGFSGSGAHTYLTAGMDWTSGGGFNLGLGVHSSLLEGVGSLPYLNIGWFF